MMARKVESKNMEMTTRKAFSNTYRENNVPSSKPPQRFAPQQLDERSKGLCLNCDNTYRKGHYNIKKFQQLRLRVKNISEDNLIDLFI